MLRVGDKLSHRRKSISFGSGAILSAKHESDAKFTQDSIVTTFGTLIANKVNGEKVIIGLASLANLASSRYPDGGLI